MIFLCASAIPSSYIVMNTEHEEEVVLDTSGELGGNVMDHHFRVGASGDTDEFGDRIEKGRKPMASTSPLPEPRRPGQQEGLPPRLGLQGGADAAAGRRTCAK